MKIKSVAIFYAKIGQEVLLVRIKKSVARIQIAPG